nr:hypothetical protein [Evansella caseinilytica]
MSRRISSGVKQEEEETVKGHRSRASSENYITPRGGATSNASVKKQRVVSTHKQRSKAGRGRDSQRTSKQSIVRKLYNAAGWSNEQCISEKATSCLDA